MAPYSESVSIISTPFNSGGEELWDSDYQFHDHLGSVQKRMFFILAVVSMIVVSLTIFALPDSTEASSVKVSEATIGENSLTQDQATNTSDTNNPGNEAALLATGGCGALTTYSGYAYFVHRTWDTDRSAAWWAIVAMPVMCITACAFAVLVTRAVVA